MRLPFLSDPLWRAVFWRTALALGITVAATAGGVRWTIGVGIAAAWLVAASIALRAEVLRRGVRELAATSTEGSPAGRDHTLTELAEQVDEARRSLTQSRRVAEMERDDVRGILEATGEGIVVVGHHQRIELINDTARRILRCPADITGRSLAVVSGGEEILEFANALRRGQEPEPRRIRLGEIESTRWIQVAGVAVQGDRLRNRAVIVLRDLTDQRHLEVVRTDFVANVTHELRSPLAAILGYAETLAGEEALQHGEARRHLERILRNSRRLDDIIQDLIELSRLEHATSAEARPVDVGRLVTSACAPYAEAAADRDIAFEVLVDDLHREVALDGDLVRQALANLVDNAVKYTPDGGRVRVTGHLEPEEGSERRILELAVSDTGPGVPREHQGRIFERFYRVDPARSRALGGTGLGLAIVKHAAALHGGTVKVESDTVGGSCFRVRLPVTLPVAP